MTYHLLRTRVLFLLTLFCICALTSSLSPPVSVGFDLCPLDANATVAPGTNVTWGQATAQPVEVFRGSSYLRPDVGGALLPWVYTIVILLVHIPVLVIRVVRWEVVQNWCLAGTLLSVVITCQGYSSTGFRQEMILTSTPILLIIDAGSMEQVIFLLN